MRELNCRKALGIGEEIFCIEVVASAAGAGELRRSRLWGALCLHAAGTRVPRDKRLHRGLRARYRDFY